MAMNTDPPAAVRRALRRGWSTSRIVSRYPVTAAEVRVWRWRARLVSSEAQCAAERCGLPVDDVQDDLDAGLSLREACDARALSWRALKAAHFNGAFDYPPQKRGLPNPDVWARAARLAARKLRRSLGLTMLDSGMTPAEVAEVVGCTSRTVRYWHSANEPGQCADQQTCQDAHSH